MEDSDDRFTGRRALDNVAVKIVKKDIKVSPTLGAAKSPVTSCSGSMGEKDGAEQTLAYAKTHARQF